MSNTLDTARRTLFQSLSGRVLSFSDHPVGTASKKQVVEAASNADFGNRASLEISNAVVEQILGGRPRGAKLPAQTLGDLFEKSIASYLRTTFLPLGHLRPGKWEIMHVTARSDDVVSAYEQYGHLKDLANYCRQHRELAAALGNDYGISPDIVVVRTPETDNEINRLGRFLGKNRATRSPLRSANNSSPILHACVSCKFTLRSDRSQNARSEALNLIRNRKGRTPHILVVTAECLPSRLASLALGTGDIDCLYHIALPELERALSSLDHPDAQDLLGTMLVGRRIRDISDLPLDLAV